MRYRSGPSSRLKDEDLLTVQDLANKWGVEASTIRWWCRMGYIPYKLLGPRRIRFVAESEIVKPVEAPEPKLNTRIEPYRTMKENEDAKRLGQGAAGDLRGPTADAETERNEVGTGRAPSDPEVKGRDGGTSPGTGTPKGGSGGKAVSRTDRR